MTATVWPADISKLIESDSSRHGDWVCRNSNMPSPQVGERVGAGVGSVVGLEVGDVVGRKVGSLVVGE